MRRLTAQDIRNANPCDSSSSRRIEELIEAVGCDPLVGILPDDAMRMLDLTEIPPIERPHLVWLLLVWVPEQWDGLKASFLSRVPADYHLRLRAENEPRANVHDAVDAVRAYFRAEEPVQIEEANGKTAERIAAANAAMDALIREVRGRIQ